MVCSWFASAEDSSTNQSVAPWTNAVWSDPNFFPLAVWLQNPSNAARYRELGINTYVGLWQGPTEEQLRALKDAGMYVVCDQNEVGLRHRDASHISAWMKGDEPDNAQSLGARLGWSSPIPPAEVIASYQRMRANDPTRPVFMNLGQGVAWDDWYGRGTRNRHPEDYPEYLKGCDIASFDIYPATHKSKAVAGNLWYVAHGVQRLVRWTDGKKPIWNCIEAARIDNPDRKPTPREVRCEVWMSLIHGSRGLIYFVHQFKPKFIEAALFEDAELIKEVSRLNRQILELAPVLNRPTVAGELTIRSENSSVPVVAMVKRHAGATYVFAVAMRDGSTKATFELNGFSGEKTLEVLGENRTLLSRDGSFSDQFENWDVHLYRFLPSRER